VFFYHSFTFKEVKMSKNVILIALLVPFVLFAGTIVKEVSYSVQDLSYSEYESYDVVRLKGCAPTTRIGEPELAYDALLALIPPDAAVTSVEIIQAEKVQVTGTFNIVPVQYPKPFSLAYEPKPFVKPNQEIYSSAVYYPGTLIEPTHVGTKAGFRLATLTVYPLQYIPSTGELFLYTRIQFRLEYEEGRVTPEKTWKKDYEHQKDAVQRLVINPEHVELWSPAAVECPRALISNGRGPTFDNPEYAIMVANGFESYFEPLKEWKSKKGVATEIFLRDWILSTYSGSTDEDKVRNFIIDYHQTHGTMYFLCVGDWGTFPMQAVNTVDDPTTPSDFWYADYDDDLYTEVYVGRASISNTTEAQTFVNKVLKYEQESPTSGFHDKIFLPAYLLWSGYGCPVNDTIALYDPPSWMDAKRYDEIDPLSTQEISDSLNVGFGYTNIAAHGAWDRWGGNAYHTNSDADGLTNTPPLTGVITAICCNIGQLDYSSNDCYVEHMMNNPNGGTAAFWGNSRHGYGQIDSYGRSEWQCIWFYDELTQNDVYNIGQTVAQVNDRCAPYSSGDEYVFHCMNTCVLHGDPELSLWSAMPNDLIVSHNSNIPLGSETFEVTVSDDRAAVENACVCLMCQTDTMYRVSYTNASGVATFSTNTAIEGDTCWITVTKLNYRPYEGFATVTLIGVDEWIGGQAHMFDFAPVYPNPATGAVTISYTVPQKEKVTLQVYNAAGQVVSTLRSETAESGMHTMTWNAHGVGAGVYFIKFSAGDRTAVQKIIFIRD
jgi:hypothetical protein